MDNERSGISRGTKIAGAFGLKGENWMRHANPASVWTRFGVLPLLAGSVWSRKWIGRRCLIPLALSSVWLFVNPVFFRPPRSTKNWASKAVFGERIWVERDRSELPDQFRSVVPTVATGYQLIGLPPLAYGLVALKATPTVAGVLIVQGGKLWYLDRMVLLFEEMKTRDTEYARGSTNCGIAFPLLLRRPAMTLRVLFHLYRAPVVKSWRIAVCATASEEGQNRRSRVLVLDGSGAADAELLLHRRRPG